MKDRGHQFVAALQVISLYFMTNFPGNRSGKIIALKNALKAI